MKNFHPRVLFTLLLGFGISLNLNAQIPDSFIGTWDQKAPGAEGYETAKVVIEKQSIATTFTNNSNNTAVELKYESDTLKYNMDVDGEYVICYLVVKDKNNLKGYATWSTGETDMILTKTEEQKKE